MVLITEIEDRRMKKPFLGGYRDKVTNVEYLNAASQTGPPIKRGEWKNTCTRHVQCVEIDEIGCQSLRNKTTQTGRWVKLCKINI